MSRSKWVSSLLAFGVAVSASVASADMSEEFTSDPISGGRAAVVGANQSCDTWLDPADAFVAGSGTLTQNLCSNWRGAGSSVDTSQFITDASLLRFSLGKTYTQNDSFSFGAKLRIAEDGFFFPGGMTMMQVNFGLTNSATTGRDRTGSPATLGDTYDSLEWDYFPDDRAFPDGWPTAQHVIFGTQNGASSSFSRLDAAFEALLPQDAGREYGLPFDTWMTVTVTYDGTTRTLSATVVDSVTGTPYVTLATEPDVTLKSTWDQMLWSPAPTDYVPATFAVDSFALMNYQDGNGEGSMPSLLATVEYDRVWFEEIETGSPVPEPAAGSLLALAALALVLRRRRS